MFFKKDTDALDKLLKRATAEPAHRPEFYQTLMKSSVYIIGQANNGENGDTVLKEGSNIQIQNWERDDGTEIIPFFTSTGELQKSITEDVSYLEIPASSLFEITQGSWLVLNPFSDHAKEFPPEEIDLLLQGTLPGAEGTQHVIEEDTTVLIGQPSEYPSRLVDSLTTLFAKDDAVDAAYLAFILNPSEENAKPHIMIGLVTDMDHFKKISAQAGSVASSVMEPEHLIDFLFIDKALPGPAEDITGYMLNETEPFYRAEWRTKIIPGMGNA